MKLSSETLRLYAVTDHAWTKDTDAFMRQIEAAIDGGAAIVQLREKELSDAEFLAEAWSFAALCRKKHALSIINDNVGIAQKVDADGVHIGQEDLEIEHVRAILGPEKIIGVSAHSLEEALRAEAAGADYLGVGAAFSTGTKAGAFPIDHAVFRVITEAVHIPVVAIGGISRENILELANYSLDGVAVVSALFAQPDVRAAAEEMHRLSCKIAKK